jgi:1-phosphofructokinase
MNAQIDLDGKSGGITLKGSVEAVTLNPSIDKTVLVDRFVPFGLNRARNVRFDPGGKGVNVARVLTSFGVDVAVSGFAAGEQGVELERQLREAGIRCLLQRVDGETRTNLKIIDGSSGSLTEINERGPTVGLKSLDRFRSGFESRLERTDIVVLGGSLPPQVPADYYAQCITLAKAKGVITLLDADGEAFALGAAALPFAVKPNLHELEQWCGRQLDGIEAILSVAQSLIKGGIQLVIVSLGADGAVIVSEKEAYQATPWAIDAISPTGAGDSMVAVLAYGLIKGLSLAEIAQLTTAAGTVTASKPGTALCTGDEVMANRERVAVTKIEARR